MTAFPPHQEARIRVMIAEMIGVALRGTDERVRSSFIKEVGGADIQSLRRQMLGELPDAS